MTRRKAAWPACARELVADLCERSPAIDWTELLLCIGGAWGLAAVCFLASPWNAIQFAAFVLSAVLFLRAGTFVHEPVRLPLASSPARETVKYLAQKAHSATG